MKASTFMKDIKTVNMKDKEKLKKLVEIIGELIKEKGNEWLIDDLLKTIEETSPIEEIAKHSVIQNINEYCIEQKIENQSNNFYSAFPIDEIKNQLIEDYRKMEHERRRDDFEGFALSMFQQVEAIVNYCFNDESIKKRIKEERDSPAFIEWVPERKKWVRKGKQRLIPFLLIKKNKEFDGNKSLPFFDLNKKEEDKYFDNNGFPTVDYNPTKKSWSFLNRLRAVLFYLYFDGKLKKNEFKNIYDPGNELYIIRNQNHRESKPTGKQQEILQKIKGQEAKYYFKFYGFLQDFVTSIETSYKSTKTGNSNKPKKTKKPSNTIGENNPELEKLKDNIEDTF